MLLRGINCVDNALAFAQRRARPRIASGVEHPIVADRSARVDISTRLFFPPQLSRLDVDGVQEFVVAPDVPVHMKK